MSPKRKRPCTTNPSPYKIYQNWKLIIQTSPAAAQSITAWAFSLYFMKLRTNVEENSDDQNFRLHREAQPTSFLFL